ncbi:hypothetical protein [Cohnella hongkongensis]|uniref:Uncharacterized protein n=1 Tax=Cohnella hongkongensis TaxID=178337 RepID=A0ABV9FCA0_9BACL
MLFAKFILASTIEFLFFFIFTMKLFRFSVKDNILRFAVVSFILAFVSNTLQVESLQPISALINVFLFLFLTTIILRVRLLHSTIMVVISFVVFSLVQWLLINIFIKYRVFSEVLPYTDNGFVVQLATALVLGIVSVFVHLSNGGFSYIESSSRFYKQSLKGNKLFYLFLLLAIIVIALVNGLYLSAVYLPYYVYIVTVTILVILVILIYFSVRKDGQGDQ